MHGQFLQLLDIDAAGLQETASLLLSSGIHPKTEVYTETLDVTDGRAQEQAFAQHAAR